MTELVYELEEKMNEYKKEKTNPQGIPSLAVYQFCGKKYYRPGIKKNLRH